jgi:ribose transport system substrate-binding protein
MRKSILTAPAIVGLALALAACGGSSSSSSSSEAAPASSEAAPASSEAAPESSEAAPVEGGSIAFSYGNESAGIYPIVAKPAAAQAESRGFDFLEGSANGDCDKQVQDLENFVTQQVSAIVVLPICGVEPVTPVLAMAKEAGITIVGYSQPVPSGDGAIVYQNVAGAEALAANAIAWYENEFSGSKDDFSWVLYTYDQCGQPCTDRTDPIRAAITAATGVEPYEAESVAEDTGQEALETLLQKDPGIDMVIGINDAGALGAYAALAPLVKDGTRPASEIYIAGMDGQTEALELIAQGGGEGGIYRASGALILDDLGRAVADLPIDILLGELPVPATLELPYEIVTTADPARAQAIVDTYNSLTQ